jgi:hypothetical protein
MSASHTTGLCLDCSYPLQGLSHPTCPECGRAFDPADPATMNMGKPVAPWIPWVLGPIRWHVKAAIVAMALITFWFARVPGGELRVSKRALLVWAAVGAVWLVWPLLRWIIARRNGWHRILTIGRTSDFVVGAVIAVTLAAVALGWPLKTAFWLSRPSMQSLVREVERAGKTPGTDRRIGLYTATEIRRIPGGLKFTVNEVEPIRLRTGFVYLPNVNPNKKGWKSYTYIGNGWWTWQEEG